MTIGLVEACLGRRNRYSKFSTAAVMVAALTALPAAAHADVTIGVLIPASGPGAGFGEQMKVAIDMFSQKYLDLGAAGKLKLDVNDSRGEVPEAISLTRKLIDTDAVAIVGPQFSSEAEVVFPLGVRAKMPIISAMSAKPGLTQANQPWAFRYALVSENDYGPLLDVWTKRNKTPIKKVVIFYDAKDSVSSYDANTVFPELLKKRNIAVAEKISFQKGDIDFSAQVTRAKAQNPDGLIVAGFYNEAGALLKEARKQGMNQPAVTNVAPNNPRFIEAGGPAVEGTLLPSDFDPSSSKPAIKEFVAEFQKRSGQTPGNAAAQIYDTLYLVADCIKREGIMGKDKQGDRNKMRDCWLNMKDREAPLLGKTTIENSEAIRQPAILTVKDGKFQSVEE